MPQAVEISGVGTVEFPDDMSREDIADRIKNQIIPRYRPRRSADSIPVVAPTADPNLEPTSNKAADFAKRVVAGVQSGVGKTIQGTVRAVDIAQDVAPVQTFGGFGGVGMPVPSAVREVNTQIERDAAKRSATRQERVTESFPYQLGKVIEEEAPETFGVDPKRDDEFMAKLATAAGEMFPTMAAGIVAGPAAVMAQYGAVAGESQAQEAIQAGRPDVADQAFLNAAALGGLSEALMGVPGKFWAIVKGARKAGVAPSAFKKWMRQNPVKGGITHAVAEGFIRESAQEGIEQVGGNVIASDIAGYEPKRKAMSGVGEAAAIGGVLGAVIGGGGAGMHQTHRNLTAQALKETREGPLNLRKVEMLPESQKATIQPQAPARRQEAGGYVAKTFVPTVEFSEATTDALAQTIAEFKGPEKVEPPTTEPTKSGTMVPFSTKEVEPTEVTQPTIPSPAGGVISPPAGVPEPPAETPTAAPEQIRPSSNPIRDLILSRHTVMEKSQQIRKMAKDLGIEVKELQERIEAEIVLIAHEKASDMGMSREDAFKELVDLYRIQPLLSARTSTSIEHQAYSTPAPLAYALRNATLTGTKTSVYDSSGGNGMLYIGSDLSKSIGNELQPARAEAMRKLGVGTVTENDATVFVPETKVGSVHVNPPFGTIPVVNYDGFAIKKLEHLIALKAMEAMKDNGTAAIVLGANMNVADTAKGAQWVFENYLYSRYHVVDNFEVDGELYGKQGAKWPVRILIVAGRRAEPLTGELAPKRVDRLTTWDEVWARSESARDEAKRIRESLAVQQPGTPNGHAGGTPPTGEPGVPIEKPSEPTPKTGGGGGSGGGGGRKPKAPKQPEREPTTVAPAGDVEGQGGGGEPPTKPSGPGEPPVGMEEGVGDDGVPPETEPGGGEGAKPRDIPKPASVINSQQIEYVPRAEGTPFGTLTPGNIGSGTHAYLDALRKRVGPIAQFVAKKIGIPVESLKNVMSADQIDGVAIAIDQIENGGALVVGDETGIGKGRQAAAILEYAKHQGKVPIFVTKDPKLFSDMYGDISDIGGTIKKPLIFGDPAKASIVDKENTVLVKSPTLPKQEKAIRTILDDGMEASGYDAIFLTYSQVNQENGRQRFLEEFTGSNDVVIVMDEAHEAAGDGDNSMQAAFFQGGTVKKGKGAEKVTVPKVGILNQSGTKMGRGGVLYLSATFAKRPDNMPLYFRTDLRKAAQSFNQIVEAMKAGGVALQQAISEALGKAGQYIRRERDFSGVKYSMERVGGTDMKEVVKHVDDVTDLLRDIIAFSKVVVTRAKIAADKSTAMSEDSMAMTEFASKVHNTIGQLLLAAKADTVVERSIEAYKKDEKPVIALMNTMESFLDEFVRDQGIKNGDPITLTWGELVKHALSRTLRATKKLPNGKQEIVILSPESLGLQDEYDRIAEAADELEVPFPVSPIDYIIQGIRKAGIKMGELTGRESGIEYTDPKRGEGIYRTFKKANKNTLVNGFNDGTLDGLLLNASGSTGLSIHAAKKFKDQRKRKMLIAQPSSDINVFIQTLGRIRRTGMIPGSAEYVHLILPLQAEIRPAAMTNQKMKSLNANTTAEASGSVKIEVDDILNKYGDQVVAEYLDANQDMQIATGIDIEQNEDGTVVVPTDVARKFTGRMAVMRDADQAAAYDQILPAYKELIEHLKTTGEYDLDIVVHDDWDAVLQSSTEISAGTDDSSILTSGVKAQQWEITDNRHVPTGQEMEAEFKKNLGSYKELGKQWDEFQNEVDDRIAKGTENAEAELKEATAVPDGTEGKDISVSFAERRLNAHRQRAERWRGTRGMVDRVIATSEGGAVTVSSESSGESQDGMLVNVKLPDLAKGLRIAPGAFRFNFLVDAPGGKVAVSGAQFVGNKMLLTRSSQQVEDFVGARKGQRYQRWILTGNPIAAFDNTGGAGKVVRFATRDGEVVTGLMMPNNWNIGKLASDPRLELINGDAVAGLFGKLGSGSKVALELPEGIVRVQRSGYGNYGISVAVPRRNIHLDKQLREIIDSDFTKTGNRMLATVYDTATLAKAVDRIMDIAKAKFRVPASVAKGDQRAVDLIAAVNEEAKPKKAKWTGATGQSGFVLDPAEVIKAIKRVLKKLGGYLKAAAQDIIDLTRDIYKDQFKISEPSDYRLAKLRWTGRQQRSWQEAHEAQRDIKAIFKDPVRDEAAHAWIEAAGDPATLRRWARASRDPARRAAYEAALTLTPVELDMVQAVRDTFAELGARAQGEGMLKNFRENYVPHIWQIGQKPRRGAGRTLRERMTHAMARTFETSFDGEQAGFEPKTKKLSEVVPIYINEMNRVIADRQFARDLRRGKWKDGEPLIQMQGVGIPVDGPEGQATLVMPDVAKNKELKYRVLPGQPALHDWIWASKDSAGNPIFLKADMALHPSIITDMERITGKSGLKTWYQGDTGGRSVAPVKWLLKNIDRAQSEYKRTMLGFLSTFHQVQEGWHGFGHRVSALNRPKIDLMNNPVHMDYANHGLMIYPDRASESEFMEGFRSSGLVSRIPVLGKYSDMYANYLFHVFIPEMKVRTMEAAVARNMKVFKKELDANETTKSAIKVLSAEQVNAAYGHLNYTDLARNPTFQHFLQLTFLAPDFLEARLRFAGQAAKGFVGAKVGREQALALGFLGLSQMVLAWLGAAIIGGDWDPRHPFEYRVGNRTYTMRSVPEDAMAMMDRPREFWFNRINPLTGRGMAMVLFGKDWRGENVDMTEIIQELAQGWLPLNIRPWVTESKSTLKPWEQFVGSVGFKISPYSSTAEMYKAAREWKEKSGDPKLVAEAKREEKETHVASDYAKLRKALENGDEAKAKEEYAKLLETKNRIQVREAMMWNRPITGSAKLEKKFVESLNDEQKAIYVLSLQTRKLVYDRFRKMRNNQPISTP